MVAALLDRLGVNPALYQNGKVPVHSPIDGSQYRRRELGRRR